MALQVFQRVVDQYDMPGGLGRSCVPVERIERVFEVLGFEMSEALFDLVQGVTRWYVQVQQNRPKEAPVEEGALGGNAAWVN